jgi:hypothetical protein
MGIASGFQCCIAMTNSTGRDSILAFVQLDRARVAFSPVTALPPSLSRRVRCQRRTVTTTLSKYVRQSLFVPETAKAACLDPTQANGADVGAGG